MKHSVAVIPGDGIGKEVVPEALSVLERAGEMWGLEFEWSWFEWGCEYFLQAGKMMDDGLEHLREQLYERVVQEVNRMPFYQKLHQRINQYREITGHLAQALEIAEGLHEGTIRVIRDAKSHVDEELQAATEMWNDRLG